MVNMLQLNDSDVLFHVTNHFQFSFNSIPCLCLKWPFYFVTFLSLKMPSKKDKTKTRKKTIHSSKYLTKKTASK